jgi:callose synthase
VLNQVHFVIEHSYPSLRVAYIDEVEERDGDKVQKVYYSVLVKAVENRDQVRQKI